jgi:hypothetical protein
MLEQARRDGIVEFNRPRVTGWQREYQHAEDELDNPRVLALPDWDALQEARRRPGRPLAWSLRRMADIVEFTARTLLPLRVSLVGTHPVVAELLNGGTESIISAALARSQAPGQPAADPAARMVSVAIYPR